MGREHYEESKRLLLQLHEMHILGTDQTPAADEIRNAMEIPERNLTVEEQERLNGLSGDLYMLTGEEVKNPSEKSAQEIVEKYVEQFNNRDWDGLLDTLRKQIFSDRNSYVACVRAACWSALGDPDVAILFADYAVQLDPGNVKFHLVLLQAHLNLKRKVNPTELTSAAIALGCVVDLDTAKLTEVIRNHKFNLSELPLKLSA